MGIRLSDHFDSTTLQRAHDYVDRGLVVRVETHLGGAVESRISNGRGQVYNQHIALHGDAVFGACSCPIGHNCKHVAAALIYHAGAQRKDAVSLAAPVEAWLSRVSQSATAAAPIPDRPEEYPQNIKDRLLYVLEPTGVQFRVDIYKGRMAAAVDTLNKSMRRYDVLSAIRSNVVPGFIRPVDLELIPALAQTRIWDARYGYGYSTGLPDLLLPKGEQAISLIRRLCETGRVLHEASPEACLAWSDDRHAVRLDWRVVLDGNQQLVFVDPSGTALQLRGFEGATFWIDDVAGRIGVLAQPVKLETLRLVETAPLVSADHADVLGAALPDRMADLVLPRPHTIRHMTRPPKARHARLILSTETARESSHRWGGSLQLPTLTLGFVYEGQEVSALGPDPRILHAGEVVTLLRDYEWEESCLLRLMEAGAIPVEELESHWPSERMMDCDLVFADGELSTCLMDVSRLDDAIDFAFQVVPALREEGWDIVEGRKWPYRLSEETASLSITTLNSPGEAFQGNDWFSLGFQAEIGGKAIDVAPLIAAFLQQYREDLDHLPDVEALAQHLASQPVYLNYGKQGYVAVDLSPLAALLHMFLSHHVELGAMHPSDAGLVRLAEEALAGSDVRFSDRAGILPLARSIHALTQVETFSSPAGLRAQLRDYQAYGSAWMAALLQAGFGGVLADDMGLGKTVQTLALLQARREAEVQGPVLLIVPTSLVHTWRSQAEQFTPDLHLVVLHGNDRATYRIAALQADLVVTTYPLLARDREWLAAHDWPLVILDEAQTLKNPASQMAKTLREIPAKGRLALTGTPLENSLQDLWTLMDWVNPGLIGDRKQFQALFRTPIEKHGDASAQARLNRRLRLFLLRRTKEQVAAELPPKTEILELVELPKPQQALYETVRCVMDARVREAISTKGLAASRITVLDALLKLRQVCCDPALVKTEAAKSVTDSAKRARLRELVGELVAEGRRVLIFSQFVEMLRLIERDLTEAGIAYLSLTGQTRNRASVLDAFAKGEAQVFLLSLKAGGVGLTLTEADTVILYDPWWNPAVERQAMDRTHRIGQNKPVFVHRLVAAGTVEERMLEMQKRKQALADALFEAESDKAHMLLDEVTLQDLFAPLGG
jgi:superfamily II DNA or RNA helicase